MIFRLLPAIAIVLAIDGRCFAVEPAAARTPRLAEWESLKYGIFVHFGMSTFTGVELDNGKSLSTTYAPTHLDVRQWVSGRRGRGN